MTYLCAIRAAFPSYSKQEAVVMFNRILIYWAMRGVLFASFPITGLLRSVRLIGALHAASSETYRDMKPCM